jgi:hypothetical protein
MSNEASSPKPAHPWIRPLHVYYLPGFATPLLDKAAASLMEAFARLGHDVQTAPDDQTDVIFATAAFGEPLRWRDAPFFQARRRFGLQKMPIVWTLLHARPQPWADLLAHFERALAKKPPDLADFAFPGMAPTAYVTLLEQGGRGGPIMAAERTLQAQALCLRLLLLIGEETLEYAYHFDLVGAVVRAEAAQTSEVCGDFGGLSFYDDVVLRVATVASAEEVSKSIVVPPPVPAAVWARLSGSAAMRAASLELGRRNFFTEMVRIADLVTVPALQDAIASQYSEGCFATWEPGLGGLIATITGSARPVDKGRIGDDDLAVVAGIKEDGQGVLVRQIEGLRNDPPSSEAFEMWDMDTLLPTVTLADGQRVPVARSKLHGHRGVAAYDPRTVEYVPMPPAYFYYPVTCGTQAQAHGIKATFARSQALQHPDDPRQIIFTILPTHGIFIIEKWVAGKAPFQVIWEAMDAGRLQIESHIPQGPEVFEPAVVMG